MSGNVLSSVVRFMRLQDEDGLTTIGMAVTLLVVLSLLFSGAQVYRINSASAEIQEIADVAALSAESTVAEFMVVVRVCDAAVLSLSLLAVCSYGLGAAAMCTPATAGVSAKLIELGGNVLKARDSFAEKAAAGLNALQKALPFLATANAAAAASANDGGVLDARYFAVAILVPEEGRAIEVGVDAKTHELEQTVCDSSESVRQAAAEAEQAAEDAAEAKRRAFERDCGDNPSYCMYERAGRLAGLPESENPLFQSVDAWSFSVALRRAQAYYAARYAAEAPSSGNTAEQANSVLRKRFYAYAAEELAHGYVIDEEGVFDANFPHLFRNTDELRSTPLFLESAYPVTETGEVCTMHAWSGCPAAAGAARTGSLQELDRGGFETCSQCEFTVSSMGNVAAASTSIDNGFEYHYEAVARAADDYQRARAELDPLTEQVKAAVRPLFAQCVQAMQSVGSKRIEALPPGACGAVAMVVNTNVVPAQTGFESSFVRGGATLGARAAVSGATLVEDTAHDGSTVVTSLLDGFGQDAGAAVGAVRIVLDCWSGLLSVFAEGQSALEDALERALGSLPLPSASGLGLWAAGALREGAAAVGLEPARLNALKPALVNTGYATSLDAGTFSVHFQETKQRALNISSSSGSLFSALVDDVEAEALDGVEKLEKGLVVAVVDFPVGGMSLPIMIALPQSVTGSARGFVEECVDSVRSLAGSIVGLRVWS